MERGPHGEPIRPKRQGERGGWDYRTGPDNHYTTEGSRSTWAIIVVLVLGLLGFYLWAALI